MMTISKGWTLATAAGLVAAASAWGQTTRPPSDTGIMRLELVTATLMAETQSIRPGEPFWAAIELRMLDGWHVNWRNPGDAGLPPSIKWRLPDGFSAGELEWPYPERFDLPELSIYGYADRVVLPCRITPPEHLPAGEITIAATVDWLACEEACVPGSSEVALLLNTGDGDPDGYSEWAREIEKARRRLPVSADGWSFTAGLVDGRYRIRAVPPAGSGFVPEGVVFFPIGGNIIDHAAEQKLEHLPDGFRLEVARARMSSEFPSRIEGVIVSTNGWGSIESRALAVSIDVME